MIEPGWLEKLVGLSARQEIQLDWQDVVDHLFGKQRQEQEILTLEFPKQDGTPEQVVQFVQDCLDQQPDVNALPAGSYP